MLYVSSIPVATNCIFKTTAYRKRGCVKATVQLKQIRITSLIGEQLRQYVSAELLNVPSMDNREGGKARKGLILHGDERGTIW